MTNFLIRLFVKDHESVKKPAVRSAYGVLSGIVGIVLNLLLFAGKFTVGVLFGSIAIQADGFNNLSDAGSSIVSLVSFKIAARPADRDHPFGHARIEYVASMIVSFLILTIGYELFRDSLSKLIHPERSVFSILTVVVLVCSILGKLWLSLFYRTIGKKIDSEVIRASAADSLSDVLSTSAVLVSTLILRFTGFVRIDAIMGLVVAVLIFIAGVKILNDTKNSILGTSPDPAIVEGIRNIAGRHPEVLGIHDMLVHSYGPGQTVASFHAEVSGEEDVFRTHDVIDNVEKSIHEELGILCTIHMDPIVTNDERVRALRDMVADAVHTVDERLSIHDFRFVEGNTHTNLIFDVVVPFEMTEPADAIRDRISAAVRKLNEQYYTVITVDRG